MDKVDGRRRHQGFRRVAARVNHVPKVDGRARDDWERQWVKKWGPRAKQGHPRKKKKFFRPLPGETPTRSSSLLLEAIRGGRPSRVPSIFPATRTGTNCDSTVATSSSSPPPSSSEERCCCAYAYSCTVLEEDRETSTHG